jgi:hypothetical protein
VLTVKDAGGAVFGAFLSEPPHCAPRFYGTGECFVFKLRDGIGSSGNGNSSGGGGGSGAAKAAAGAVTKAPCYYPWARAPGVENAFFQYANTAEGLGVGGSLHWALWLEPELLRGSSGDCATFASPPLAAGGAQEFEVIGVELWAVH